MANAHGDQPVGMEDDAEINVTHFIPSVQLKGTRAEKLEKLHLLIDHLEGLRRSLVEPPTPPREWREESPMQLTQGDRWWAAGLVLVAALVLAMLDARACATTNDTRFPVRPQPRMARLLPQVGTSARFRRQFDDRAGRRGSSPASWGIISDSPIA
jgi:hypothetical protein